MPSPGRTRLLLIGAGLAASLALGEVLARIVTPDPADHAALDEAGIAAVGRLGTRARGSAEIRRGVERALARRPACVVVALRAEDLFGAQPKPSSGLPVRSALLAWIADALESGGPAPSAADAPVALDRLRRLRETTDLDNTHVRGAVDGSLAELAAMNAAARDAGVPFGVLLVPSAEGAAYELLLARGRDLPPAYHAAIASERRVSEDLVRFCVEQGIDVASALPVLAASLSDGEPVYAGHDSDELLPAGQEACAAVAVESFSR